MVQPDRGSGESGQYFVLQSLQNLYRTEWYEFVRPTAHGLQLEETPGKIMVSLICGIS